MQAKGCRNCQNRRVTVTTKQTSQMQRVFFTVRWCGLTKLLIGDGSEKALQVAEACTKWVGLKEF